MLFRLHSTPEINTPALIGHLVLLYRSEPDKSIFVFRQGFKTIPFELILGILEQKIQYTINDDVVVVDTK